MKLRFKGTGRAGVLYLEVLTSSVFVRNSANEAVRLSDITSDAAALEFRLTDVAEAVGDLASHLAKPARCLALLNTSTHGIVWAEFK